MYVYTDVTIFCCFYCHCCANCIVVPKALCVSWSWATSACYADAIVFTQGPSLHVVCVDWSYGAPEIRIAEWDCYVHTYKWITLGIYRCMYVKLWRKRPRVMLQCETYNHSWNSQCLSQAHILWNIILQIYLQIKITLQSMLFLSMLLGFKWRYEEA